MPSKGLHPWKSNKIPLENLCIGQPQSTQSGQTLHFSSSNKIKNDKRCVFRDHATTCTSIGNIHNWTLLIYYKKPICKSKKTKLDNVAATKYWKGVGEEGVECVICLWLLHIFETRFWILYSPINDDGITWRLVAVAAALLVTAATGKWGKRENLISWGRKNAWGTFVGLQQSSRRIKLLFLHAAKLRLDFWGIRLLFAGFLDFDEALEASICLF